MKIDIYNTVKNQDDILKKSLDYIAFKDDDLEEIVNIVYKNINKSIDEVVLILFNKNFVYIENDEIDKITLWFKRHTRIELN